MDILDQQQIIRIRLGKAADFGAASITQKEQLGPGIRSQP